MNSSSSEIDDWLLAALDERRNSNQLRQQQTIRPIDSVHVEIDGLRYVNFCSNNYLGLTHHPHVIEAIERTVRSHGTGAGASGLISGYTDQHASAEAALAAWKGTEGAILLPSGYQANHAIVQAIAAVGPKSRFLIDKLAHASLIDAVRGSGVPFRVFPHNNLEKLERLLSEADHDEKQIVVTESIFSMDGDFVPLRGIASLKVNHPFILLLDEAHGSGVYGECGSGYANELGLTRAVDLFIVTLSKALGGVGGAICASRNWCEAIVNFGRAYIYSTELPASAAAGCEAAAIEVMSREPERQKCVRDLAQRVRSALNLEGDSPIVPLMLGEEPAAISAAKGLREKGMLVLPVRPPTVPRGTSRLRITLSCDHTDAEVEKLIDAIRPTALKGR